MGTLVLAGATSGSTTLTPTDAVTATITLPSATATLATLGANTFTGNQAITGTLSATSTGTFSGGIVGTTTNNAAAAGCVGEFVSSTIAPASAVTITTTTTSQDITTISLTAGDWLVSINGAAQSTGSVTARMFFWIGTIAGNDASEATAGTMADFNYALPINATVPGAVPSYRISLASTTTVRYKAWANFSGSQPTMQGRISATRVR